MITNNCILRGYGRSKGNYLGYAKELQVTRFKGAFVKMPMDTSIATSQGGQVSRAPVSYSGRLGNRKFVGSNPDLTVFQPWSSQTNHFKIDTFHSQAWCLALLGEDKDWLAQCQDNATEWDSRSWC